MSQCDDIAERAAEIGSSACAITDHGNIAAAVDFSKEAKDLSLKPILGCEFYVAQASAKEKNQENRKLSHQVILAKNLDGWKDLLGMVSCANHDDNFYYKPRIDLDIMADYASRGNLVSFSGHLGSTLASVITDEKGLLPDWKAIGLAYAQKLQGMFGKENFFIEIQLIDSEINKLAKTVGEALRELASSLSMPCVATPDAHYCRKENAKDQRVLLCTSMKTNIPKVTREIKQGVAGNIFKTFFASDNYHIPSYEEMAQFHTEEELENTNLVRDMCKDYDILSSPKPPAFDCPNNADPGDYLRHLCRQGWKRKMSDLPKDKYPEYGARVNHELEVFTSIGLSSYFLIVDDILNFVRQEGYITGPGRGSAAGCMVSNLLGITQIDPIKYDLILERFYNAGRNTPGKIAWPDIDFDIPRSARDKTHQYIRDKYGKDNVAQIITFQTLKGRAALTRVMQAQGNILFDEQKAITRCIQDEAQVVDELKDIEDEYGYSSTILWALENSAQKLKNWCYLENGKIKGRMGPIFEQAIRLEHTKIISGKHPAGIVISDDPISNSCPMVADKKGSAMLAGFDGPACEEVGLLKFDCLTVRGLDKVMDVEKILQE